MAGDLSFWEKLGWSGIQNGNVLSIFADFFSNRITCLSTRLPQFRYIHKLQGHWNNYKISPISIAIDNENNNKKAKNNKNNKTSNKDLRRLPNDDLDELYGVYN